MNDEAAQTDGLDRATQTVSATAADECVAGMRKLAHEVGLVHISELVAIEVTRLVETIEPGGEA